jgi:hypothetical protein
MVKPDKSKWLNPCYILLVFVTISLVLRPEDVNTTLFLAGSVHVVCVVGNLAPGQGTVGVLRFSSAEVIPPTWG